MTCGRSTDLAARSSNAGSMPSTRAASTGGARAPDILERGASGPSTRPPRRPRRTSWPTSPNGLAVDTGGIAIRNENDFGKALNEVAADTSSYYVLGYRPTNTVVDGTFRSISVRVKRRVQRASPQGLPAIARPAARAGDGRATAVHRRGETPTPRRPRRRTPALLAGAATPVVVEGVAPAAGHLRLDVAPR